MVCLPSSSVSVTVDDGRHLPSDTFENRSTPSVVLGYLLDENRVPYTEEDERVFQTAQEAHQLAQRWLSYRGLALVSLLPMTPLVSYVFGATTDVTLVLSVVSGSVGACLSMAFSGLFPDRSSDTANRVQDVMGHLKEYFRLISDDIRSQITDPGVREQLERLNVESLRVKLSQGTGLPLAIDFFHPLLEVKNLAQHPS